MTVLIGFITPRHAERMLSKNQTDVGAEIDHLRNGGFVGRGMRMQLTPDGFKVSVSQSALAGYCIEPAHLHPTPLQRGVTHFEQYSRLQAPAKPVAAQPELPETVAVTEPKPLRYRYRLVRKRFKGDREHDTGDGTHYTVPCYQPKQGRRRVRNPEVPRKPWSPMVEWVDWVYGDMAELSELNQLKPVRGNTDMRYMPHETYISEEDGKVRKLFRGRMRQSEWKHSLKKAAQRSGRRKINAAIREALKCGEIRHDLKFKCMTYQGFGS